MSLTLVENEELQPGQRLIHLSHGDGKITRFDKVHQLITAEFNSDTDNQFSRLWHSLVPLGGYFDINLDDLPIFVKSSAPLKITVPVSFILNPNDETWSIPLKPNDYNTKRREILNRIKTDPITVDLVTLKSTEFGEYFSRTLLYFKYLNRAESEELIVASIEIVDFITARYLKAIHSKQGIIRYREFEYVRKHIGKNFWASVVYSSGASLAMRRELDRILISLIMTLVEDIENIEQLRAIAKKIINAIEKRIKILFADEFARRSTLASVADRLVEQESDAIAASA